MPDIPAVFREAFKDMKCPCGCEDRRMTISGLPIYTPQQAVDAGIITPEQADLLELMERNFSALMDGMSDLFRNSDSNDE